MNDFFDYHRILFDVNGIGNFLFLSDYNRLWFNISQHPVISLVQCNCWFVRLSGEHINIHRTRLVRHVFANFDVGEVIDFEI